MMYFLGIDPGLTHTAVALVDEQHRILAAELVLVNIPKAIKKQLDTNMEAVNYKLAQIYNRVSAVIQGMLSRHGISEKDVVVTIEGFWFRENVAGKPGRQKSAYDTVAGVAATKCVLFQMGLNFSDIMPQQVKRIISWKANGVPEQTLEKDDVADCVRKITANTTLDDILSEYARGCHEHLSDAVAIAICGQHVAEYDAYMKIPLKKRKQVAGLI